MIDRACTSKNVMPLKAGVSNVRVTARCSNNIGAGCAGDDPSSGEPARSASHRIAQNLEHSF
jgi:hypothetical protein